MVLTNLRMANAFHGALRQRIFEILFGAERKSEQMVAAAARLHHDAAGRTRDRDQDRFRLRLLHRRIRRRVSQPGAWPCSDHQEG